MNKTIKATAILFIVAMIAFMVFSGCESGDDTIYIPSPTPSISPSVSPSPSPSPSPDPSPMGYALMQKALMYDQIHDGFSSQIFFGLVNNTTVDFKTVPSGTHTINYRNGQSTAEFEENSDKPPVIDAYYVGNSSQVVATNVVDNIQNPSNIVCYNVMVEASGPFPQSDYTGNFIFSIAGTSLTIVEENEFPAKTIPVALSPAIVDHPIVVSWTNDNADAADYVYIVEAYVQKGEDSDDSTKKWSSIDTRFFDFGNPAKMTIFSGLLESQTATTATIPAGIFAEGEKVNIDVIGIKKSSVNYDPDATEKYGAIQMIMNYTRLSVTISGLAAGQK